MYIFRCKICLERIHCYSNHIGDYYQHLRHLTLASATFSHSIYILRNRAEMHCINAGRAWLECDYSALIKVAYEAKE